ncbi:hypothetical protein [Paraburkholderia sacchari]|nr:hypothetical protein [Paraburkholderia sacchari]
MAALIGIISSTAAHAFEAIGRFSVKALNRHLEYCELLAEAQRRY